MRSPLLAHAAGTEACDCLVCSPLSARFRPAWHPAGVRLFLWTLVPRWGLALVCQRAGALVQAVALPAQPACAGTGAEAEPTACLSAGVCCRSIPGGWGSAVGRTGVWGGVYLFSRACTSCAQHGVPTHRAPCSSIARLGSLALESHARRRGGARLSRAVPELSNIRSDTMVWLHAMKEAMQ